MAYAKNINLQIFGYLEQLQGKKKAVLTVVKTLAEETFTLCDVIPDEVRKGVERAIEQSKKVMGRSHEDVMKKYKKWLKK